MSVSDESTQYLTHHGENGVKSSWKITQNHQKPSKNGNEIMWKCRGNVAEMSQKCRGNVAEMSRKCRGPSSKCRGPSPKCRGGVAVRRGHVAVRRRHVAETSRSVAKRRKASRARRRHLGIPTSLYILTRWGGPAGHCWAEG